MLGGGYAIDPMDIEYEGVRSDVQDFRRGTETYTDLGFRCARDGTSGSSGSRVEDAAHEPPPGSPERHALMDAVRLKLGSKAQFKVKELVVFREWAYFEGIESIADGRTVAAVLKHAVAGWSVLDITTDPPHTDLQKLFAHQRHLVENHPDIPRELRGL